MNIEKNQFKNIPNHTTITQVPDGIMLEYKDNISKLPMEIYFKYEEISDRLHSLVFKKNKVFLYIQNYTTEKSFRYGFNKSDVETMKRIIDNINGLFVIKGFFLYENNRFKKFIPIKLEIKSEKDLPSAMDVLGIYADKKKDEPK